jgi:nitrogen regulatory protein PII
MRSVKRIEVVIDALQLKRLLKVLDEAGVSGYTVLPNARGRGERGARRADELTGALENAYVFTACPPEEADRVVEAITPMLERFGGICLVSDAEWVRH